MNVQIQCRCCGETKPERKFYRYNLIHHTGICVSCKKTKRNNDRPG